MQKGNCHLPFMFIHQIPNNIKTVTRTLSTTQLIHLLTSDMVRTNTNIRNICYLKKVVVKDIKSNKIYNRNNKRYAKCSQNNYTKHKQLPTLTEPSNKLTREAANCKITFAFIYCQRDEVKDVTCALTTASQVLTDVYVIKMT